ncbi:hypothetical protein GMORB2_3639 [Geosmithia morbida]|uniref:Uncharacterized protein n=1 Tax=Geosmithia morbida TaxID=1094350 RepID=A0A9P4YQV8_9HYPO|nr:uncharacterized protein GMORB2_3639 [Geosmithia morbida]KAF4119951.1 hypothetical protein GMORB2_3639 [Geosmithia morbida]
MPRKHKAGFLDACAEAFFTTSQQWAQRRKLRAFPNRDQGRDYHWSQMHTDDPRPKYRGWESFSRPPHVPSSPTLPLDPSTFTVTEELEDSASEYQNKTTWMYNTSGPRRAEEDGEGEEKDSDEDDVTRRGDNEDDEEEQVGEYEQRPDTPSARLPHLGHDRCVDAWLENVASSEDDSDSPNEDKSSSSDSVTSDRGSSIHPNDSISFVSVKPTQLPALCPGGARDR